MSDSQTDPNNIQKIFNARNEYDVKSLLFCKKYIIDWGLFT